MWVRYAIYLLFLYIVYWGEVERRVERDWLQYLGLGLVLVFFEYLPRLGWTEMRGTGGTTEFNFFYFVSLAFWRGI